MDVSFSSKAQTLTLTSYIRLSSSSSSSSYSSSFSSCYSYSFCSYRCCSLRREFLGGSHRLRTPGLRSRRKCRQIFQIQSLRLPFRASLYSKPILFIVAVATFSALTIVYLNYTRRKKGVKELSDPEDSDSLEKFLLSEQGRGFIKMGNESRVLTLGKLSGETPIKERKAITEETGENGHVSDEKGVKLSQFQKTALTHEETLITNAFKSPGFDVLASTTSGTVSTIETEDMGLTLPPLVLGEIGALEQVKFARTKPELPLDEGQKEAVFSAFAHPVQHAHVETNQDHMPKHEVGQEIKVQISGFNGFFKQSVREDLYSFYKENHFGVKSISNFNSMKTVSPHISFAHSNKFSSPTMTNMLNEAEQSVQDSHSTAGALKKEYLEGQIPSACYTEGSSHKRMEVRKDGGFTTDMGKRLPPQNGHKNYSQFRQPKGMHFSDKHDVSEYFIAYNRLLRDGRLTDCMELLEEMEGRSLLDMNKVYHAKFFNTCKIQKAVMEAFRFTKLIVNPTLSTFNMLLSVCASSQDSDGAFEVMRLVKKAGLKADCKLYTTLISTCAKCGKVDAMFEVFHEMVNAGVEPNVHTYGSLIDGCARAGQIAKAFGAYGIMRSKKVKPDRVVFNALITACGQSGAVDRAFDVLAEMKSEPRPVDPDHITIGALIKTCTQAGQVDRAREVYKMIHEYNIKGTPEVYTIAVNSCSQKGDLEFALSVYNDMTKNGVVPDEMFLSALVDVAGHAGKVDVAFEILQDAKNRGLKLGNVSYSSLMGACSNAKNWQKALELYENLKAIKLHPTVSTMNALINALCDGNQLQEAVKVLAEMKKAGVFPNAITYSILLVASEKMDELELGFVLLSQAKKDGVVPNLTMCRCLTGMCLRRFEKVCSLGEHVLSFNSGKPQIDSKWTSMALTVYRETIVADVVPTMEVFSQVLGCLQLPHDSSLRNRLVENLGVSIESSRCSNIYSLIDGFGEYDSRAFSLLEEAASLGIVPCVSFKQSPIIVDARKLLIHAAEVYLLTVLKGLKHRLAAGAKLPNITILLPIEKTQILSPEGNKTINLAGRIGQAVGAMLRRLGLPYQGNESYGKIRINGLAVKRWFQPKLDFPFSGKPAELNSTPTRLGKGIIDQQRNIRNSNLSLEQGAIGQSKPEKIRKN